MKKHKKVIIVILLAVLIFGFCLGFYQVHRMRRIEKSYYPMGGDVVVVDKIETDDLFYIVIEEPPNTQFKLSCDKEEYDQVDVGDIVNCDRRQSILTYEGEVREIRNIRKNQED